MTTTTTRRSGRVRGFTLIEVMVAMVVVLLASVGAIVSLMAASRDLREGQLRLQASALVDARIQRVRLQDKLAVYNAAVTSTTYPDTVGVGVSPWVVDPVASSSGDLSSGSLFVVLPDGTITPCTSTTAPACDTVPPPSCTDSSIPSGVYCREVIVTRGTPVASPGNIIASGTMSATVWVRVSRKGEAASRAILARQVVAL